jgi:DNA modification methylase
MELNIIHNIHTLTGLAQLPDNCVNCIVTSPPYYGLRNYNIPAVIWDGDTDCKHQWNEMSIRRNNDQTAGTKQASNKGSVGRDIPILSAFCQLCGAWRGDLGLEPTIDLYVKHITAIFSECRRVLRKDGTLWLNMGDSYASGKGTCYNPGGGKNNFHEFTKTSGAHPLDRGNLSDLKAQNIKPKDLLGMPWRVAFALLHDGWYLRDDIIWSKPNPMPESVTDRPTRSHEYIFLLSKSKNYYYDQQAILEPASLSTHERVAQDLIHQKGSLRANGGTRSDRPMKTVVRKSTKFPLKCNKRSVWTVSPEAFSEAHFATFPQKLITDCIKAGCPVDGVVLDPFMGSGTTGIVARKLNRNYIGFEISAEYMKIANRRIYKELGAFK